MLSGVYSQTHTPISQIALLQYFSTKPESGARGIIVHFFMDYKIRMHSNAFVFVVCALLVLKCVWCVRIWLVSVSSESVNASDTIKLYQK